MKPIFKDKVVIITGHTGFKGSWLSIWLKMLGARVVGISNNIPSQPSNFEVSCVKDTIEDYHVDIRDSVALKKIVTEVQPDFIFHLAAQALVKLSYESPIETINTNVIGTANLLDSLRYLDKHVIAIMITSDKAYDNVEWKWGYRENDRLGGKDPYSASKGMAELTIKTYFESFFNSHDSNVKLGIARAGNVIGGGDWGKDRIVPDCMIAWSNGKTVDIRSPNATRPWQHVLEPLSGYLNLAMELSKSSKLHGEAYNFGPPGHHNFSVMTLINEMNMHWDNILWNDVSNNKENPHEAGLLKLNCDKAEHDFSWNPTLEFSETVQMTVEWYKSYYENTGHSMSEFSINQINQYMTYASDRGLKWIS